MQTATLSFQNNMNEFLQQVINGLAVGGIYALVALGYTMVYGVLKLINFAHGDLFTIGAYLGFTMLGTMGLANSLPAPLALGLTIIATMIVVGMLGMLIERVAYRPLRSAGRLSAVVSALGASIFLQNAVMLIYGPTVFVYPESMRFSLVIDLFGITLPVARLFMIFGSIALMLALYWFIHGTRLGTAIRAAAVDQNAARLVGIDVNKIIGLVFLIGPGLGGIAGVMVGIYYGQIDFTMGWIYGLKAFTAAILGGIGNIPGAMLGGLLLGLIEALGAAYLTIAWKDAIAFLVLILILILRPTGLLGERVADKL